jgi:hypothetical protein
MTTRNHTDAFKSMRNSHKMNRPQRTSTNDNMESLTINVNSINNTWLSDTEIAKNNIKIAKSTLKKLERMMSDFYVITFDDDEDDNKKLQDINNMSKTLTNQLNMAKNSLLAANSVPITVKNQNEISIRKNIINNLVKQVDDCNKDFKRKHKVFISNYQSMVRSTNDDFWNPEKVVSSEKVFKNTNRNVGKTSIGNKSSKIKSEQIPLIDDLDRSNIEIDDYSAALVEVKEVELMSERINQRDLEITKLAESVEAVSQLFLDLHLLTLEQGAVIDNIEANIDQTAYNVESGVGEIKEASKLQKKGRPILCCIFLVAMIIILVVVILVVVLTKNS